MKIQFVFTDDSDIIVNRDTFKAAYKVAQAHAKANSIFLLYSIEKDKYNFEVFNYRSAKNQLITADNVRLMRDMFFNS